MWAIENANGLGWLLSHQLVDVGEQVRDVPPGETSHPAAARSTETMSVVAGGVLSMMPRPALCRW